MFNMKQKKSAEKIVKEWLEKPKLEHKVYFVNGRKVVIDSLIPYNQTPVKVAARNQ